MGDRNRYISGETPEEKLANVERVLQRLDRRIAGNRITGIIPPIPLFSYSRVPEDDGTVFRFISPIAGKLKNFVCKIEKATGPDGKPLPHVELRIYVGDSRTSFSMNPQKTFAADADMPVEVGSQICARVVEKVEGVWFSLSFALNMNEYSAKDFKFEEVFGGSDEGIQEDN